MSSRQLRKLQHQRELEKAELQAQEGQESSDEEPVLPTKPKASLFASFAALENNEDDEEETADVEDDVEVEEVNEKPLVQTSARKSNKSKKKKKKAKNNAKDELPAEKEDKSEDIDAIVKELNLAKKEPSTESADSQSHLPVDPEYERVCALLSIGSQHLKVGNEMRRLFGKEATGGDADDDAAQAGRSGRRRNRPQQIDLEASLKGQHKPGQGLSSLTIRRNNLIEGKQDWPKATTGGLTMAVDNDGWDDGTVIFKFVHDEQYQDVQRLFQISVASGQPQALIGLLMKNPYHISLLIQVSKIAKNQGDHALASDLLERALFTMGRAATSTFNTKLSLGKARLDFSRPENRVMWLAGYHYIKSLMMKGTYRTALEWAKFLLSLDPDCDPYSMRLLIHQLALKSGEYQWLLDLGECAPGMWNNYDCAVHTTPSLALAAYNLQQGTRARELLTNSMQKLPWLFVRLFKELSLPSPSTIWGCLPRNDAETLFTDLYVLQTKDLWNTPALTALLMEIAHTIPTVDIKTIPRDDSSYISLDVVRFLYVDDNPTLMALAPSNLLHRPNNSDHDPLPPLANIYSYPLQREALEDHGAREMSVLERRFRDMVGLRLEDDDEHGEGGDDGFSDGEYNSDPEVGRRGVDYDLEGDLPEGRTFLDRVLDFMGMVRPSPPEVEVEAETEASGESENEGEDGHGGNVEEHEQRPVGEAPEQAHPQP